MTQATATRQMIGTQACSLQQEDSLLLGSRLIIAAQRYARYANASLARRLTGGPLLVRAGRGDASLDPADICCLPPARTLNQWRNNAHPRRLNPLVRLTYSL